MARCKHEPETIQTIDYRADRDRINILCSCGQGWFGGLTPWYSTRGRRHAPPRWVNRAAAALTDRDKSRGAE